MLKLMIVDDEMLVRELIKRSVDWETLGFKIVGCASTAAEALPLIEEMRPDVLFTDVRMPGRTGLDLGREVLSRYPDIKVVVISGYDEFAYVKEGLSMGIFDYILKPIAADVLEDLAGRVRKAVKEERAHRAEYERLKKEFAQNYDLIRERQLGRLLSDDDINTVTENLKFFHINLEEGCCQAAVLECKNDEEIDWEEDVLKSIRVHELMEAYFDGYPHVYCFERRMYRFVIINNTPGLDFEDLLNNLIVYLRQRTDVPIRVSMGGAYTDMRQLAVSYKEAKEAVRYSFILGNERVIRYKDLDSFVSEDTALINDAKGKFAYYLRQGMMKDAINTSGAIFDSLRSLETNMDKIRFRALELATEVFSAAADMKIDLDKDGYVNRSIQRIFTLSSLEDVNIFIEEIVHELSRTIQDTNRSRNLSVVSKVVDYVREHFDDPELTLSKMSAMFYVNPNYLSRAFKEKTGKTFREYLLTIRMQQALMLLRQTDQRSYEVAEKVGIKDPAYFSFCFKKTFGMSVQEMMKL